MNGKRIVLGIILIVLIVAAIAYLGTSTNLNHTVQQRADTQKTEQETH